MFDFHDANINKEKCYTTIGELPTFVDPEQPPTKKQPFSAVANHPFVHSVRACSLTRSIDCCRQRKCTFREFTNALWVIEPANLRLNSFCLKRFIPAYGTPSRAKSQTIGDMPGLSCPFLLSSRATFLIDISKLVRAVSRCMYIHCRNIRSNYIAGDILMISEGRSGVDNVYSLKNG